MQNNKYEYKNQFETKLRDKLKQINTYADLNTSEKKKKANRLLKT